MIKKIYNYEYTDGQYGTDTLEGVLEGAKYCDTDIYTMNLATLDDLIEWTGMTGEPIKGVLKVQEGFFQWMDLTFLDPEGFMGYVKIPA